MNRTLCRTALGAAIFTVGYLSGTTGLLPSPTPVAAAAPAERVFEMRTYTAPDGKLDALNARFREHTLEYFEKHGMTNVGYWMPIEGPEAQNTIVYLLAHDSREAARESWAAFGADEGWREVSRTTQLDGPIVSRVESVFLTPTDYSPIK